MGRTVTSQIRRTGDTPWVGARVSFRLKAGSYTTASQYPQDRIDAITDANGNFSAELWGNSAGLLATTYICRLPDGDEFEFILPNGTTPITLSELRSLSNIPTPSPPTLIDIGDARYRQLGQPIPASDITGLVVGGGLNVVNLTQSGIAIAGNIYYADSLSIISLQLPTTATIGDHFEVVNSGSGTLRITQGAGQQITIGDLTTTAGATGRIDSTIQGDWLEFRYFDRWYCTVKNGFIEVA